MKKLFTETVALTLLLFVLTVPSYARDDENRVRAVNWDNIRDNINHRMNNVQDRLQDLGDNLRDRRDNIRDDINHRINNMRDRWNDRRDQIRDRINDRRNRNDGWHFGRRQR